MKNLKSFPTIFTDINDKLNIPVPGAMWPTVTRCAHLLRDVPTWYEMCPHVTRCAHLLRDVPTYCEMCPPVSRRFPALLVSPGIVVVLPPRGVQELIPVRHDVADRHGAGDGGGGGARAGGGVRGLHLGEEMVTSWEMQSDQNEHTCMLGFRKRNIYSIIKKAEDNELSFEIY